MPSVHLEIRGRVQGVGFRWFVVEAANDLKLAGWVRNKSNGNVEIAASGPAEDLTRFQAAVKSGPRGARVESVTLLPPLAADELGTPFAITR